MAGTIFVSKDVRVSVSTNQFDYFTERVRSGFSDSEKVFMGQIYSPMDDGGMMFISAESQDIEGFNIFLKAVQKARKKSASEKNYSVYQVLWDELESKILSDPRGTL
ncbi:hypothetical protein ACO0K9_18930 [Undibacterium sp. Ji50W]|uniref:hypothetical protein n=1 Tax=Undibacterium sp. Ji50W TaxID=3413041 RepID=UPI003BF445B5